MLCKHCGRRAKIREVFSIELKVFQFRIMSRNRLVFIIATFPKTFVSIHCLKWSEAKALKSKYRLSIAESLYEAVSK